MITRYPIFSVLSLLGWVVASSACGVESSDEQDARVTLDAGMAVDAHPVDAANPLEDADVTPDASEIDAGVIGVIDGGEIAMDAGVIDAGMSMDAAVFDAGARDAGVRDAGARDAGVRDAGARDAFVPPTPDAGPASPLGVGGRRRFTFATPVGQQYLVWPRGYLPLADGSVIIVGHSATYSVASGTTSPTDGFILWLEPSGTPRWSLALGSEREDSFAAVAPLGRDFIAVGGTRLSGIDAQDAWMVRFDANGHIVWSRRFGGPDSQILLSAVASATGEVVATGSHIRSAGDTDAMLAKIDANGELSWSRRVGIGAANPPENRFAERGQGVLLTTGGSILLVGNTTITEGGSIEDIFTAVLTSDGTTVSSARRLGVTDANQALRFVAPRADGTFVAGFVGDVLALLRADGTVSSLRQVGAGTSILGGIESEGQLLVAGYNLGGYIAATDGLTSLDGERSQSIRGLPGTQWQAWGVTHQPDGSYFMLGTTEQGRLLWIDRVSASFEAVECSGTLFSQALEAMRYGMHDLAFVTADVSYVATDFAVTTNALPISPSNACP
jgi:hypothetical protein